MKKVICLILALLALPAALADHVVYQENLGAITVVSDSCAPGEPYVLMCLRGSSSSYTLSGENLLLIRQLTADSSGSIRVAMVGSREDALVFLVGGRFPDGTSPHVIGGWQRGGRYLPAGLTRIEEEAFMGTAFQEIYLSRSVEVIGPRAFKDCASLRYIEIPETVYSIGEGAFDGCDHLVIGCRGSSAALAYAVGHGIPYEQLD